MNYHYPRNYYYPKNFHYSMMNYLRYYMTQNFLHPHLP